MTTDATPMSPDAGTAPGAGFLSLPGRPPRPRQVGVTHVIDKGLSLPAIEGILDASGDYIDIVKLGWGTAYVTRNLRDKLALYRDAGVPVVLGGTFWEVCQSQHKLDDWRRWVTDLGLQHVEVSDGTITLPARGQAGAHQPARAGLRGAERGRLEGPRRRSSRPTAGSR